MSAWGAAAFIRVLSQESWRASGAGSAATSSSRRPQTLRRLADDGPRGLHQVGQQVEVLQVAEQADRARSAPRRAGGVQPVGFVDVVACSP